MQINLKIGRNTNHNEKENTKPVSHYSGVYYLTFSDVRSPKWVLCTEPKAKLQEICVYSGDSGGECVLCYVQLLETTSIFWLVADFPVMVPY